MWGRRTTFKVTGGEIPAATLSASPVDKSRVRPTRTPNSDGPPPGGPRTLFEMVNIKNCQNRKQQDLGHPRLQSSLSTCTSISTSISISSISKQLPSQLLLSPQFLLLPPTHTSRPHWRPNTCRLGGRSGPGAGWVASHPRTGLPSPQGEHVQKPAKEYWKQCSKSSDLSCSKHKMSLLLLEIKKPAYFGPCRPEGLVSVLKQHPSQLVKEVILGSQKVTHGSKISFFGSIGSIFGNAATDDNDESDSTPDGTPKGTPNDKDNDSQMNMSGSSVGALIERTKRSRGRYGNTQGAQAGQDGQAAKLTEAGQLGEAGQRTQTNELTSNDQVYTNQS